MTSTAARPLNLKTIRQYFRIPRNATEEVLFKKMIVASIALHIAVFIFFFVKASFFSGDPIDLDSTIRVDMVGLPDKVTQLPPAAKPKEPPKAETKPEVKTVEPVVLHPTKPDTSAALKKIKEMAKEQERKRALEAIQQEVKADEQKAAREAKVNQILKGNAVNAGSALHGLQKSEFNDYASQVYADIHQHWNLPEFLKNDSLSATVVVYMNSLGVVIKRVVRKSSGNSQFDDLALKAVDEASPFPKPPDKFAGLVKDDGIVLGFPQ